MKKFLLTVVLAAIVAGIGGILIAHEQSSDRAPALSSEITGQAGIDLDILAKKCHSDSQCPYGQCKSGQCGACNSDYQCKDWGKCKSGQCGACNSDSQCKGWGKCSRGWCTKSPY